MPEKNACQKTNRERKRMPMKLYGAVMSPFVRKTAAHAIPKLHSLDPEQKEELVS